MHQGLRVERLENLLRHLQTYLVLTFYNLIYDLCENPGWTLPDALQYRVFLYDQMMKRLADKTRAFPTRRHPGSSLDFDGIDGGTRMAIAAVESPDK